MFSWKSGVSVEGGHDIDVADIRVRVAATSIFARLLAGQRSIPAT